MKTMERNKSTFYYLLYTGKVDVLDEEDNKTGEKRVTYGAPVKMRDNVSAATGQAQVEQFGNFIDYDKVIVTTDTDCPIDEDSVLFVDKEPEYDDNGNPLFDYTVRRVARSLNSISIALRRVNVS